MALRIRLALCFAAVLLASAQLALAEDHYIEENGVTYRVSRSTTRRTVPRTEYQEVQRTHYRDRLTTDYQATPRSYSVPVTEYRWEARWHGRYNPFASPYLAYHFVPRTHWEQRTEHVQLPVTRRELVPEQVTVRTPVVRWETVDEEVTRKVAVGPSAASSQRMAANPASRVEVGGVAQMQSDPPRQPSDWRPATSATFVR